MLDMVIYQVNMTENWCAQRVSNLEGWRRIDLVVDFSDTTPESLDARICQLEQRAHYNSPPPTSKVTYETLVYRLRRIERQWVSPRELQIPAYRDIDQSALITILRRLHNKSLDYPKEDKISWLGAVSQQLCHTAGRYDLKAPDVLETVSQLYAFAVELSLDIESRNMPTRRPAMPHHGLLDSPPRISKACCGCCACYCHKDSRPLLKDLKVEQNQRRGFHGFKWLKKLWCFKSKDDDDSSISLADFDD
jgi:hypothetical protein